jgi:hypothetical protein
MELERRASPLTLANSAQEATQKFTRFACARLSAQGR